MRQRSLLCALLCAGVACTEADPLPSPAAEEPTRALCTRDEDCLSRSCDLLSGTCRAPVAAGVDAGPEDAGSACASKYECAGGQVCASGHCAPAPSFCTGDASCPRGTRCDTGPGACVAGCTDTRDCEGSTDGPVCDLTVSPTWRCGRCHPSDNPCPGGQACVDQACAPAVACTSSDACSDLGLACTAAQVCGNCSDAQVCSDGFRCKSGHCEKLVFCTDDAICRAKISAYAWCNTLDNICEVGACTEHDHCPATAGCDLTTHTCVESIMTNRPASGATQGVHCESHGDCASDYVCVRDNLLDTSYCNRTCGALLGGTCSCPGGWGVMCWDASSDGYTITSQFGGSKLMNECSGDRLYQARPGFCY